MSRATSSPAPSTSPLPPYFSLCCFAVAVNGCQSRRTGVCSQLAMYQSGVVSDFRKLDVWRKSHELAMRVHKKAGGIRGSMNVGLRNQMVRAAMSIPANIVEGSGQESRCEFARFLRYAANSANELEYHLIAARDGDVFNLTDFSSLSDRTVEVRKMLRGLIKRVAIDCKREKSKAGGAMD
jgi:four helix bundle protein